jgi:hypothetical protein
MTEITAHGDAGRRWQCPECNATMCALIFSAIDNQPRLSDFGDPDPILPPSIQSFLESL